MVTAPVILELVERTDEKIENLESLVKAFIARSNGNKIRTNSDIQFTTDDPLCVCIDDIISDLWQTLKLVVTLLQRVGFTCTCEESEGCWDLSYPAIEYGLENESATPIIDQIARNACKTDGLCEILNELIAISDKPNRKLRIISDGITAFRRHGGSYSEKSPHPPVVVFVRDDNGAIQNANLKAIAQMPEGHGLDFTLTEITDGIRTFVERFNR